jgi:hypothetical protein
MPRTAAERQALERLYIIQTLRQVHEGMQAHIDATGRQIAQMELEPERADGLAEARPRIVRLRAHMLRVEQQLRDWERVDRDARSNLAGTASEPDMERP